MLQERLPTLNVTFNKMLMLYFHYQVVTRVDKEGRNVLFYTVAGGRLDTLCYLLDNGALVHEDYQRVNILMEAVNSGQVWTGLYYPPHYYAGGRYNRTLFVALGTYFYITCIQNMSLICVHSSADMWSRQIGIQIFVVIISLLFLVSVKHLLCIHLCLHTLTWLIVLLSSSMSTQIPHF